MRARTSFCERERYATIEGLLYWKMLLSVDSVHMCGNMRQEGAVTGKNTKGRRQKEREKGEGKDRMRELSESEVAEESR